MRSSGSLKMMIVTESHFIGKLLPFIRSNAEWAHEITALALVDTEKTVLDDSSLIYEGGPVIASKTNPYDILWMRFGILRKF